MRLFRLSLPLSIGLLTLACGGVGGSHVATGPTGSSNGNVEVYVLQSTITLKAKDTAALEASVSGAQPDQSLVVWTIESRAGTLTPTGPTGLDFHCTFTAPATAGTTVVKAASKNFPSAYKNITLTITP